MDYAQLHYLSNLSLKSVVFKLIYSFVNFRDYMIIAKLPIINSHLPEHNEILRIELKF